MTSLVLTILVVGMTLMGVGFILMVATVLAMILGKQARRRRGSMSAPAGQDAANNFWLWSFLAGPPAAGGDTTSQPVDQGQFHQDQPHHHHDAGGFGGGHHHGGGFDGGGGGH